VQSPIVKLFFDTWVIVMVGVHCRLMESELPGQVICSEEFKTRYINKKRHLSSLALSCQWHGVRGIKEKVDTMRHGAQESRKEAESILPLAQPQLQLA
jgi:hypothetical protein